MPVLIIDPGHGGEDGGAVANDGTVESGINLSVALMVEDLARLAGWDTVMTRREDISIHDEGSETIREKKNSDLRNRVALCNSVEGGILISIHQNSLPSVPSVHGAQVFYNGVGDSEFLAQAIQDELNRKMAFVERFRAKATKARQAGSRQKMAKKLEKELEDYRPEPKRKELNFTWPEAPHSEKVVLAAADLAFHFPDGKTMWPPLTFTIYRGQRTALVGHNGCGKSTLLKLLAGTLERCGGNVVTAPQMRLGYYTQHQMDTLRPDTTVLGEIRRLSDPRTTEEELMSVLGLFLLGQEYFDRQVSKLSGGEKSRLVLASLFLKRCNFLLLDEPTNHLDLESREALGTALQKFDGTLLMVAHDRWLLSQVGAEAWALDEKGITVYPDFASYDTARRAALESGSVSPSLNASNKAEKPDNAPRANLSREEQKRLKREQAERRNALHKELKPLQQKYAALEGELEKAMNEQSDVETQLADPAVYADGARSTELLKRFNELRDLTERLMEDMAALEEQIAAIEARRADIDSMGDLA